MAANAPTRFNSVLTHLCSPKDSTLQPVWDVFDFGWAGQSSEELSQQLAIEDGSMGDADADGDDTNADENVDSGSITTTQPEQTCDDEYGWDFRGELGTQPDAPSSEMAMDSQQLDSQQLDVDHFDIPASQFVYSPSEESEGEELPQDELVEPDASKSVECPNNGSALMPPPPPPDASARQRKTEILDKMAELRPGL